MILTHHAISRFSERALVDIFEAKRVLQERLEGAQEISGREFRNSFPVLRSKLKQKDRFYTWQEPNGEKFAAIVRNENGKLKVLTVLAETPIPKFVSRQKFRGKGV